jgi:hypothetical protein
MYTLLVFPNGRRADAVVLSSEPGRLRLAVAGRSDAVELIEAGGRWLNESGIPVEFGAIFATEQAAVPRAERTMAAGVLPC